MFDASLLSASHEPVLSFEVYSQAGMVLLVAGFVLQVAREQHRQLQRTSPRWLRTQQHLATAAVRAYLARPQRAQPRRRLPPPPRQRRCGAGAAPAAAAR